MVNVPYLNIKVYTKRKHIKTYLINFDVNLNVERNLDIDKNRDKTPFYPENINFKEDMRIKIDSDDRNANSTRTIEPYLKDINDKTWMGIQEDKVGNGNEPKKEKDRTSVDIKEQMDLNNEDNLSDLENI